MTRSLVLVLFLVARVAHSATYGPANDPCVTTGGTVLTTASAWETTIAGAAAGSMFLLRAGTYNFGADSNGLLIPSGVTVRAYNCEDVLITGTSTTDDVGQMLRMEAGATLRGMRVEAATGGNRHEHMLLCKARDITLLNNTLYGGTGDAIAIGDACSNFLFQGNRVNGSSADNTTTVGSTSNGGHNFIIGTIAGTQDANNIVLRGNRICSDYFPDEQRSDDVIAVIRGTNVLIEKNYFPIGCTKNRENILDIKTRTCSAAGGVIFRRNYVERNTYTGTVGGQDNAPISGAPGFFSAYLIMGDWCGSQPAVKHHIEYNYIGNAPAITGSGGEVGGGIAGVGTGNRPTSTYWHHNVILQDTAPTTNTAYQRMSFGGQSYNGDFFNNTYVRGVFRHRNLATAVAAEATQVRNNIYDNVYVTDETTNTNMYVNNYNTFYSIQGPGLKYDDGNNMTTDNPDVPLLRDSTGTALADLDLRLADASPAIGSASDGKNRGVFQEVLYTTGTITGTTVVLSFTSDTLPLSRCVHEAFDIEYNGINVETTACVVGPASNQVTLTMASAPPGGATVTAKWTYGAVEDSLQIGGPEVNWNNKIRTQTAAKTLTNASAVTTWVQGTQIACSGSNRLVLAAFCWEDTPTTTPLEISNVRVGGQLGTKIADVDNPDGDPNLVGIYGTLWYFTDAMLVAATNSTLTYTTNKTPDPARPLLIASGCYPDITDQSGPLADSAAAFGPAPTTFAEPTPMLGIGSIDVGTPPLTTTNPGAAVLLACGATATSWTVTAPWQERLDVTAGNTLSQLVADAVTMGTPITPYALGTDSTRRVVVAVTLDGGTDVEEPPPHQHRQTHVTMYRYGEPEGQGQICAVDGVCELAPTRRFVARAQIEIEGATLPSTVFEWWCSDNNAEYYQVTSTSSGWISFATSMRAGEVLTSRLPLEGDTFVACGTQYAAEHQSKACGAGLGERLEYEMSAVVSAGAVPGQDSKCELRKGQNILLDTVLSPLRIVVTSLNAQGF